MFCLSNLFGRHEESPDAITFDTVGWTEQPRQPRQRVWHNARGDGLGLFYFPIAPDVPAPLDPLDRLWQAYRSTTSGGLIKLDVVRFDGVAAIKLILKVPQQPHGMTYLGSWTFPWRDFSYVLKIQCREDGMTGIRDAVVLAEEMGAGRVQIDDRQQLRGWSDDPYDSDVTSGLVRNLAEDEKYDARFPDHPLSRLRRYEGQLESTIVVAPSARRAPPFYYSYAP
jgi:hypothetical protein